MTSLQIVAGVVVGVVVMLLVLRMIVGRVAAAGKAEIEKHYRKEDIVLMEPGANSFGLESGGAMQLRGNGGLVLTSRVLHFFMLVPRREIKIALGDIREVKTVRSHLGKTVAQPLLHVRWNAGEAEDAVAWWVRDVEAWKRELSNLRT